MRLIPFRVAPLDNGTYILADEKRDAIVIDPSGGEREIMAAVRDGGLRLLAILNTHGHADHVWGNAAVKEATQARLAIHRLDAYRLEEVARPESVRPWSIDDAGNPQPAPFPAAPFSVPDDLLDEGPVTYLQDVRIEAVHTPGHTEGSTSFYLPDEALLFSGDLPFRGNIGRVDLPGGDPRQMEASLRRVSALPARTRVYPGHGPPTTLSDELPWLKGFRFAD